MEAVEVVQAEVIAALVRAFTGDLDQARASLDRWAAPRWRLTSTRLGRA